MSEDPTERLGSCKHLSEVLLSLLKAQQWCQRRRAVRQGTLVKLCVRPLCELWLCPRTHCCTAGMWATHLDSRSRTMSRSQLLI